MTEVPETEVLQDRTGSDANPALLCYVRKARDLVHTLHRRVLEDKPTIPQEEDEGIVMDESAAGGDLLLA